MRLLGVCTRERPLCIIMEYMARGSLKDVLRLSRSEDGGEESDLDQRDLVCMCRDIARGMEFLSRAQFVHRDLATRFDSIFLRFFFFFVIPV